MNEKRRKMIVYACLPLAVVWALFNLGGNKDQALPGAAETIQTLMAKPQLSALASAIDTARLVGVEWGRDPFVVTAKTRPKPAPKIAWAVTGIMYNPTDPIAYVNGRPVRVGDRVDLAEVIEIAKDAVTLEYQGNRFKITVTKG